METPEVIYETLTDDEKHHAHLIMLLPEEKQNEIVFTNTDLAPNTVKYISALLHQENQRHIEVIDKILAHLEKEEQQ